ncbi:RING-type E3 ubiquitin transferase [Sarracenia purpurea var. burkii]
MASNLEPENLRHMTIREQNMEVAELCSQQSYLECVSTEEPICDAKTTSTELLDRGYMQYGYGSGLLSSHLQYRSLDSLVIFSVTVCASFDSCYRRRFRIRAPCCNEIFDCRHCHNEAKVSLH